MPVHLRRSAFLIAFVSVVVLFSFGGAVGKKEIEPPQVIHPIEVITKLEVRGDEKAGTLPGTGYRACRWNGRCETYVDEESDDSLDYVIEKDRDGGNSVFRQRTVYEAQWERYLWHFKEVRKKANL